MIRSAILVFAFGGAALASGPAYAVTVANASFETPNVGSGFTYNPTSPGATFASISGIAGQGSGFGYAASGAGTQVGFLQGNASTFGVITQAVSGLTAGSSYLLTFLSAARPGYDVLPVTVSFDGTTLGSFTPTSTTFATQTFRFIAGADTGSLSFAGQITPGDFNAAVDNVSIAAVPEPATWAMMIGGVAAVGGTLRRRKANLSVRFG